MSYQTTTRIQRATLAWPWQLRLCLTSKQHALFPSAPCTVAADASSSKLQPRLRPQTGLLVAASKSPVRQLRLLASKHQIGPIRHHDGL